MSAYAQCLTRRKKRRCKTASMRSKKKGNGRLQSGADSVWSTIPISTIQNVCVCVCVCVSNVFADAKCYNKLQKFLNSKRPGKEYEQKEEPEAEPDIEPAPFNDEKWAPDAEEAEEVPPGEEEKEAPEQKREFKFEEPLCEDERQHQLFQQHKGVTKARNMYAIWPEVEGKEAEVRVDILAKRCKSLFKLGEIKDAVGDLTYEGGRRFAHFYIRWKKQETLIKAAEWFGLGNSARFYISSAEMLIGLEEFNDRLCGDLRAPERPHPEEYANRFLWAVITEKVRNKLENAEKRRAAKEKKEAEEKAKDERRKEKEQKREEKEAKQTKRLREEAIDLVHEGKDLNWFWLNRRDIVRVPSLGSRELGAWIEMKKNAELSQLDSPLPCTLTLTDIDGYEVEVRLRKGQTTPYDSSTDEQKRTDKKRHVIIVGPSGAGKDTQLALATRGKRVCLFGGHDHFMFETYAGEDLLVCNDSLRGTVNLTEIIGACDWNEFERPFKVRGKTGTFRARQHRTVLFMMNPSQLIYFDCLSHAEFTNRFVEVNLYDADQSLFDLRNEFLKSMSAAKWSVRCADRLNIPRPRRSASQAEEKEMDDALRDLPASPNKRARTEEKKYQN